jgi:putative cell wall-binding protein
MINARARKLFFRAGLVTSVAAVGILAGGTTLAGATPGVTAIRLAGSTRFATAGVIASAGFSSGTPTVVLASGLNYPDALAASYLGGRLHSPVLLTTTATLDPSTLSSIRSLGGTGVEIVGGTAAVSQNVTNQLKTDGFIVDRIAGSNRFATASAVGQLGTSPFVGSLGTYGRTAIVASGVNFPDALAGSAMAYSNSFPILLTQVGYLPAVTATALSNLHIAHVLLLGGTSAVSPAVETTLVNDGMTVQRIAGNDRTQTATDIAAVETGQLGFSTTNVDLARGDTYPDALTGGAYSGEAIVKSPILLADSPFNLGSYTTAYLKANASTIATIHIFGGTSAITTTTSNAAVVAAGG